jgi:hypothetical protein
MDDLHWGSLQLYSKHHDHHHHHHLRYHYHRCRHGPVEYWLSTLFDSRILKSMLDLHSLQVVRLEGWYTGCSRQCFGGSCACRGTRGYCLRRFLQWVYGAFCSAFPCTDTWQIFGYERLCLVCLSRIAVTASAHEPRGSPPAIACITSYGETVHGYTACCAMPQASVFALVLHECFLTLHFTVV